VGPTFKGAWGHQVTIVSNGVERTISFDAPYLRRSLLEPNADIVKGYPPIMPKFPQLTEEEIEEIIEALTEARSK
jgi:cytochrome c oxidase subunit 2